MKRTAVTALLALLVLTAAAPTASAATRCTARGAKTVLKNSQARIFYVPGRGKVKRVFYGCRLSAKPRRLIANVSPKSDEETHVSNGRFRLAGTQAAWVGTYSSDFGAGEFGRSIEVRPLGSSGRRLSQDVSDYGSVLSVALRPDGAVAWLLAASARYTEVDGVESDGKRPIAFAYARNIAGDSLSLDSTSVHWTEDGTVRSGALR